MEVPNGDNIDVRTFISFSELIDAFMIIVHVVANALKGMNITNGRLSPDQLRK